MPQYGGRTFDREYAADDRDHPAAPLLAGLNSLQKLRAAVLGRTWRLAYYTSGSWAPVRLDQGPDGACVAFAWNHWKACSPVRTPNVNYDMAMRDYHRMQQVDEFPETPPAEGTSGRAGAKVMKEQGLLSEYVFLGSVTEVAQWVSAKGPVPIGVNWTERMMDPDDRGFIVPEGGNVGGHEVMVRGVAPVRRYFRITNSWGAGWGVGGECLMSYATLENRLADDGDAIGTVQVA